MTNKLPTKNGCYDRSGIAEMYGWTVDEIYLSFWALKFHIPEGRLTSPTPSMCSIIFVTVI